MFILFSIVICGECNTYQKNECNKLIKNNHEAIYSCYVNNYNEKECKFDGHFSDICSSEPQEQCYMFIKNHPNIKFCGEIKCETF